MINLDLNICHQALAVQQALKTWSHDYGWDKLDVDISTFPLFNGRERGLCLVIKKPYYGQKRETLLVSFGERRGGDSIFVECIVTNQMIMNGPTRDNFSEESYRNRSIFDYLDIESVCKEIESKIRAFV